DFVDIFNYYDLNGDGTLNYKEFISIIYDTNLGQRRYSPQKQQQQQQQQYQQQQQQQQQQNDIKRCNNLNLKNSNYELSFQKFKQKLLQRGATGILGIGRQFRIIDDDNSKTLNFQEFRKSVRDFQVDLTEQQINEVFQYFDRDGNGTIDYDEFILSIRGPMNQNRKKLAQQAFKILDKDGSGVVDLYDIKQIYNGKMHPDVKSGKRTEESVLLEFINTFESYTGFRGIKDGQITQEEFEEYYSFISASIDRDDYFELMMNNAWRMNDGANKNWQTKGCQYQQNKIIKGNAQEYRSLTTQNAPFGTSNIPVDYSTNLRPNINQQQQSSQYFLEKQPQFKVKSRISQQSLDLFQSFRQKILSRGTRGIQSLSRLYKIIDDDNNKKINTHEFIKCCKDLRMGFSDQESAILFRFFDIDGSGEIDYDEFLFTVRGEINQFRKGLVMKVFNKLDKNKNGYIELDDIIGIYNAKQHPDVKNGKKTEEEILGEFLDTFEIHHAQATGNKQGRDKKVSKDEFIEYYTNVSASIDDDKYFEVMIRNAWKI
ncbi:hypothetical protein IMG5_105900, partial [Ichthyophthirius multifiliis]